MSLSPLGCTTRLSGIDNRPIFQASSTVKRQRPMQGVRVQPAFRYLGGSWSERDPSSTSGFKIDKCGKEPWRRSKKITNQIFPSTPSTSIATTDHF
jgi:hypothetical protein